MFPFDDVIMVLYDSHIHIQVDNDQGGTTVDGNCSCPYPIVTAIEFNGTDQDELSRAFVDKIA